MDTAADKPTESHGSSPKATRTSMPAKSAPVQMSAIGKPIPLKTEIPHMPTTMEPAFAQADVDDLAAGNQSFTVDAKDRGHLGVFIDRALAKPKMLAVPINGPRLHTAIVETLEAWILKTLKLKQELTDTTARIRAHDAAHTLADGCIIMMYLRTQSILISDVQSSYDETNLNRPRVQDNLVISGPYAYAIQQLGIVHVADLATNYKIYPTVDNSTDVTVSPPAEPGTRTLTMKLLNMLKA